MDIASESSYPTPFAQSPLLPLLLVSLSLQKNSPKCADSVREGHEYDFIVVGAGSAGSVVASRLSELPCVSVLLLEAGKPPPKVTDVPAAARSFIGSDIDWAYKTVPQSYTGNGLVNKEVIWPSGKALGGSSVFNAMLNVRGNHKNYDDWEKQGATGWGYKDVLPYFKKLEDNQDADFVANGYHGTGGPVTIMQPKFNPVIKEALVKAAKDAGYPFVDSNGPTQRGFYDHQASIRNGQRCSTAKAYLVPAENRENLDILPNAFVRKVIIENNRAVGVSFDHDGTTHEVRAKKEVIMSAGTVNSAQLLMLSGIGPKEHLEDMGIPVVADLPVGKNFQDHCATLQPFSLGDTISPFLNDLAASDNINTYIQNRTGPLTSTEGVVLQAFLNNFGVTTGDFPDHQIYFLLGAAVIAQTQLGLKPDFYEKYYGPHEDEPFLWCLSQILQPKSRGTVELRSSDPLDHPLIDPNYFAETSDLTDVVEGMKTCQKLSTSQPLKDLGSKPFADFPDCDGYEDNDEEGYFRCQAKSVVFTTSHQVGTAKMGKATDPTTVVDPELRVKGIAGLRVVDASIMPIIPSGNTNIPTIMVAEKASDIIKTTIKCGE